MSVKKTPVYREGPNPTALAHLREQPEALLLLRSDLCSRAITRVRLTQRRLNGNTPLCAAPAREARGRAVIMIRCLSKILFRCHASHRVRVPLNTV